MKRILLILLVVLGFLFMIAILPIPIPPYLDFQVVYDANMGLLRGIALYDHTGQVNMIARLAVVPPGQVFVLPFPYPPWYALVTLPLALIPIQNAVRIWFGINLLLLFLSVWLLTDAWPPKKRLSSFLFAFIFIPSLGALWVGQYVFPILLGASLLVYSIRKKLALLTALGFALLTFKPHLGLLILLAALLYLWVQQDDFGRRSVIYTGALGIALFGIGFFADPLWPLDYVRSLLGYGQTASVSQCGLCASLPLGIERIFDPAPGLVLAAVIGSIIFLILLLGWSLTRRRVLHHAAWLITLSVLILLLASPYLLNYDFVLLLLPLFFLAGLDLNRLEWGFMIAAFIIPFISLGFFGRQGNLGFSLSAILLIAILYQRAAQLDGSPDPAYNPVTIE